MVFENSAVNLLKVTDLEVGLRNLEMEQQLEGVGKTLLVLSDDLDLDSHEMDLLHSLKEIQVWGDFLCLKDCVEKETSFPDPDSGETASDLEINSDPATDFDL